MILTINSRLNQSKKVRKLHQKTKKEECQNNISDQGGIFFKKQLSDPVLLIDTYYRVINYDRAKMKIPSETLPSLSVTKV